MSLTNNQNKPIVIGNPVEIEFAVNEIRKVLATMDWITHPYFIAQRFTRATGSNGRKFSYPETYAPTNNDKRGYHRLTPDNDYKGMFFFMVGTGNVAFEPNGENFITYPVSIIFSANLELINSARLTAGLFTQELIRDARRLLTKTMVLHDFDYTIKTETRELRDVYREFVLDDLEQYNRAPMQCFRLELDVQIQEDCKTLNLDYCEVLKNGFSLEDQQCVLPTYVFDDQMVSLLSESQRASLINKLNVNNNMEYLETETINFQVVRIYEDVAYILRNDVSFPFTCSDFKTEFDQGFWIPASQRIYVRSTLNLPPVINGVITLKPETTYIFVGNVDLQGARLISSSDTVIFGDSSENSSLTSTGLPIGVPFITANFTTPIQNIEVKDVDTLFDIDGSGNNANMDWTGFNIVNVPNMGSIKNIDNFIFDKSAIRNSQNLFFDGTFGTIAIGNSLVQGDGSEGNIINLEPTCVVIRRFRINDCSIIAFGSTNGINVDLDVTIPPESYILNNLNFSGGSTYLIGIDANDNRSSFKNCKGILNTNEISQYYMNQNATTTVISQINTPVKVLGATTSSPITQKFENTNNRSEYIGSLKRVFRVSSFLSLTSGNNNQIGCYIAKNGQVLNESEVYTTTSGTGRSQNIAVQTIVELKENDFIEVFVENTSSTQNILVSDMNTTIN